MKIYLVGGAVRDEIMGLAPKDLDYVVVGSTPEEMLLLGFKQVGADFPVFLHPETGDEYALAREEVTTGTGYRDFSCNYSRYVTLEDDLWRRDLTINAIAKDIETGEYIDPCGGISDINNRMLSSVSDAFIEDPVRVLRAFRFLATLPGTWRIRPYTQFKIDKMVREGNLKNLTAERVWKEMEKALSGHRAWVFFSGLSGSGLFPEIDALYETPQREDMHPEGNVGIHTAMVVNYAANHFDSRVAFAGLCHDFGKPAAYRDTGNQHNHESKGVAVVKAFCKKWKVPNDYKNLALMTCEYHTKVHGCFGRGPNKPTRPGTIMKLLTDTNALVKKSRFFRFLEACEADAKGRGGSYATEPYLQKDYIEDCLIAAKQADTKSVSEALLLKGKSGIKIGMAVRALRIEAITKVVNIYNKD